MIQHSLNPSEEKELLCLVCGSLKVLVFRTVLFLLLLVFETRFLVYPSCHETDSRNQAGLELRDLPAPTSPVLVSKECTATTKQSQCFLIEAA